MSTEEAIEEIRDMFRETDRQENKPERPGDEFDRILQETRKVLDGLTSRVEQFMEHSVKPAVVPLFEERGIQLHEMHRDTFAERDGLSAHVDMLLVNDDICVVLQARRKLRVEDVDHHVERMEKFKRVFPRYNDARALGAVAAIVLPDEVAKYAYRRGFFVITYRGEDVVILNDEDFTPAEW
jgi:hypothetical protein